VWFAVISDWITVSDDDDDDDDHNNNNNNNNNNNSRADKDSTVDGEGKYLFLL